MVTIVQKAECMIIVVPWQKKEYTHIINQKEVTDLGQFLKSREPYDKYKTVMNGTYFVDKSEILEELIPVLQQEQRFFCITRPRRFGKTIMANSGSRNQL